MNTQRRTIRLWLGLGTAALVATQGMAADAQAPAAAAPPAAQGGEGGEGGEGGVEPARAAADPAAFLVALDVIAAHAIAARDIYPAGGREAAAEMFAHGLSEVYATLEEVFLARGIAPFGATMERASALAQEGAPAPAVAAAAEAILAALRAAEAKAPPPGPTTAVRLRVAAEMVERAALQYGAALRDAASAEAYLDGYGFWRAAAARAAALPPATPATAEAMERLRDALALLAAAYPAPTRPAGAAAVAPGTLLAASSRLRLALD